MRALVTGGAGFIGSNIVDALLARDDEVTVVDDLSTGSRENLAQALERGATLVEADVRDASGLAEIFASAAPEVVFHLAAQIDVRVSTRDPALDAQINVGGTISALAAARAAGVARFVNVSSGGAAYGEAQTMPVAEGHPIAPLSPYGQSKFAAEGYCELYTRLHGLSTISLRLANVYGPRQDPLGEAGVIAMFCGRLMAGERPLVYGDGLQVRDYIYVGDVVAAALAAVGSAAGGALNIGLGREVTVLDLVAALGALREGAEIEPVFKPERLGEVRRIALDSTRAREQLGWAAQVELDEGLRRTLETVS